MSLNRQAPHILIEIIFLFFVERLIQIYSFNASASFPDHRFQWFGQNESGLAFYGCVFTIGGYSVCN